jgi:hypothetical protein
MMSGESSPEVVLIDDGKVAISDGTRIPRANVAFGLAQHKERKDILGALDGTVYQRMPNGSLKRLTRKKHDRRMR